MLYKYIPYSIFTYFLINSLLNYDSSSYGIGHTLSLIAVPVWIGLTIAIIISLKKDSITQRQQAVTLMVMMVAGLLIVF